MILSKLSQFVLKNNQNVRQLTTKYKKTLEKHPVLVQAVQAGILMGSGDFIAQTIIEKRQIAKVDFMRTLKFLTIGFCVVGPGLHKWYGTLEAYTRKTAKTSIGQTIQKVFIDQVVFAPVFLAILLSIIGYSQLHDVNKVKAKLQSDYKDILLANYTVWPWVQIINFQFVPLNYQVLLAQTVAVLWNVYFSWRTNLKHPTDAADSTSNPINITL